jgi:hypothetical protein
MTTQTEVVPESTTPMTPERVLQLGLGFWASKTVLTAVEVGIFTQLAEQPLAADELRVRLGLHPRSARDFFDALVSLGLLERDAKGLYANAADADLFLDRTKPSYIGGILEMANARLYPFWGALTEALRSGEPQNEAKHGGDDIFAVLYSDPQRLRGFLHAMTGISMGASKAIAAKFPWQRYRSFADIGTSEGGLPVELALAHEHLAGCGFDLPPVEPVFAEYVGSFGLSDRIGFRAGDFFVDPLPQADVITMGHILHDWPLETKKDLLAKAYVALPADGALLVFDAVIDDQRRSNSFGLLMSLNMLIETTGGFDYTGADCQQWMREVGFRETYVEHLAGPDSMVVGIK